MQQNVLDKYEDDFKMYVIWMPVLESDRRDRWKDSALNDERIVELWDEKMQVGRWLYANAKTCDCLGSVAWDAYYLFDEDTEWADAAEEIKGCGTPVYKKTEQFIAELDTLLAR